MLLAPATLAVYDGAGLLYRLPQAKSGAPLILVQMLHEGGQQAHEHLPLHRAPIPLLAANPQDTFSSHRSLAAKCTGSRTAPWKSSWKLNTGLTHAYTHACQDITLAVCTHLEPSIMPLLLCFRQVTVEGMRAPVVVLLLRRHSLAQGLTQHMQGQYSCLSHL